MTNFYTHAPHARMLPMHSLLWPVHEGASPPPIVVKKKEKKPFDVNDYNFSK